MLKQGYKQTEIGVIPEDWEVVKIGKIANTFSGGTPNSKVAEYYNGDIPWISSGELNKNKIHFTEGFISQKGLDNSASKMVNAETLLVAMYGATAGVVAITYIIGAINQAVLAIENDNKVSNNIFLKEFLQLKKEWILLTYTQGGQPNLNQEIIKNLQIPLPPLPEQEAIAEALSDADAWIESLEQLIAKKRLIKQGAMQELLTPKEDWEVKKLGEVCDVRGGGTPSTSIPEFWNGNILWFTPTEVGYTKYLINSLRKITELGLKNSSANILPVNTILLTSRAGIGDLGILKSEASTNQGFQSLVCKDNVNYEFVYYMMQTKKNELLSNASGSTFLEISPNKVKAISFDIPSLSEQTRIATILSDMDAEIEALEQKLSKARQIKQGMMQELLTGRVRLCAPMNKQPQDVVP